LVIKWFIKHNISVMLKDNTKSLYISKVVIKVDTVLVSM